ncbi:MAG TPA: EthD family reductase [Geobacterales bacterium]|nr:EthD family reductase [Geobacterales bacterium]
MYKILVIYPKPSNLESFEEHYKSVHIELVKKLPKLRGFRINKIYGSPSGEPEFYLLAELLFDSKADLEYALKSNEMRDAARDAMKISEGKMKVMFAEEYEDVKP